MDNINKFLKWIMVIIGILVLLVLGYIYKQLKGVQVEESTQKVVIGENQKSISGEIGEEMSKMNLGIEHILVIGTDARENKNDARSDATMLITLDSVRNNIKLTSFARDAYVNIAGHGYDKLTHAYAYGKSDLLMDTVRDNFGVDVKDYVEIDCQSFIKVIDLIEGVPLLIEEIDLTEFNRVSLENYEDFYEEKDDEFQRIDEYGEYLLNGYQTLAYVRMRKTDSTTARDGRQREIVEQVFNKVMDLPLTQYPKLLNELLACISTNMSPTELVKLGFQTIDIGTNDIRQLEFPEEAYSEGTRVDGGTWVLQWEEATGRQHLQEFLIQ